MRRTVHGTEVRTWSLVVMNVSNPHGAHVSVRPQPRSVSIRPFAVRSLIRRVGSMFLIWTVGLIQM